MTREQVLAAKARAEAVTPGDWSAHEWGYNGSTAWEVWAPVAGRASSASIRIADCHSTGRCRPAEQADAEFIAHARTDVPALVSALERVLALADQIRNAGDDAMMNCNIVAAAIRRAVEGDS